MAVSPRVPDEQLQMRAGTQGLGSKITPFPWHKGHADLTFNRYPRY